MSFQSNVGSEILRRNDNTSTNQSYQKHLLQTDFTHEQRGTKLIIFTLRLFYVHSILGDEHNGGKRLGINSPPAPHPSLQAIDWQSIKTTFTAHTLMHSNKKLIHEFINCSISNFNLRLLSGKWHIRFWFTLKVTQKEHHTHKSSHTSSSTYLNLTKNKTELIDLSWEFYFKRVQRLFFMHFYSFYV